MYRFNAHSMRQLGTCDPRLQRLFFEVIKHRDCSVIEGYRGEKDQNEQYDKGTSKLRYPDSAHNRVPSRGVDVVPYPVPDWDTEEHKFREFAHFVAGVAATLEIPAFNGGMEWGWDWPHWELRPNQPR